MCSVGLPCPPFSYRGCVLPAPAVMESDWICPSAAVRMDWISELLPGLEEKNLSE